MSARYRIGPPRRCRVAAATRKETGSVSIEFAIVMSALLVGYLSLTIVAGRILRAENDVRSAAHAAARAASLRNSYDDAVLDVETVVAANLAGSGVSCQDPEVAVTSDRADFMPGGWVTVRVACTARSLGPANLPDTPYAYEATETIDLYRGEP